MAVYYLSFSDSFSSHSQVRPPPMDWTLPSRGHWCRVWLLLRMSLLRSVRKTFPTVSSCRQSIGVRKNPSSFGLCEKISLFTSSRKVFKYVSYVYNTWLFNIELKKVKVKSKWNVIDDENDDNNKDLCCVEIEVVTNGMGVPLIHDLWPFPYTHDPQYYKRYDSYDWSKARTKTHERKT